MLTNNETLAKCDELPLPNPANVNSSIGQLQYCHLNIDKFGRINDTSVPAPEAIAKVRENLASPYYHMVLSHSDKKHNKVVIINDVGDPNIGLNHDCDAIFVRRDPSLFCSVGVFVGDCPTVILMSPGWVGFIHSGTPEIFGGIWETVCEKWPANWMLTTAYIGPGIGTYNYEFQEQDVPGKFGDYLHCHQGHWYLDVIGCIKHQLTEQIGLARNSIFNAGIDNYNAAKKTGVWASNRYWTNERGVKSRRDLALLVIEPRSNTIHYHVVPDRVDGVAIGRHIEYHEDCLHGGKHSWNEPLADSLYEWPSKPTQAYTCNVCGGILDQNGHQNPDGTYPKK